VEAAEKTAGRQSVIPAKERILSAAIARFAQHSFDVTSLREIAADAEVDVAYVHRSFGSKSQLFEAALGAAKRMAQPLTQDRDGIVEELVRGTLAHRREEEAGAASAFELFIHSLGSREASHVLRNYILEEYISPLSEKLGETTNCRAALTISVLAGVTLFRVLLEMECLQQEEGGELEAIVTDIVARIIEFDRVKTSEG